MKHPIALWLFLALSTCLAHAQTPARTGRDYAVFFYVIAFQPGWAALPETKTEAEAIKTELESEYGFQCELVANPTKQQMRQKIREYNARLTSNDQMLYFFSMHGHYSAAGDRGYLVGKDGQASDEYGDTWLSYDDLRTDLAPCKAKHLLLALDACHSGAFGIRNKSGPDGPAYDEEEDCATKIGKTLRYPGRQYCSSGNKDAKTPARSLFAARFLEALRKGGDGKLLRFDDLEYWLGKVEAPKPESGTFAGHEPGGDFVFARNNACAAAVPTLDRDADGIPDAADRCPDEYGAKANAGCPVSGLANANTEADTDYDGIPDARDGCPTEYGTAKANGCPDRDNDGVPDKSDKCKDKAGEPHWQGCPDTDGDGLPDHEDQCPTQKGLAADKGCPPPDRDGDGVPDKADKCPDQAGQAHLEGCPESTASKLGQAMGAEGMPDPYGLLLIKGAAFTMGCTSEQQNCSDDEKPAHQVTVSDFYIGKYEVTQKQWKQVMGNNPSRFSDCDNCPVEQVSWDDVQEFLKKLNAGLPAGQKPYRLPTESEWEYAARGGNQSKGFLYAGDTKNIGLVAWYSGNSGNKTHPVGERKANELGLFDMSGNVWEWCGDWYSSYASGSQTNPTGPDSGSDRVQRGGSWSDDPRGCRVAFRFDVAPGDRSSGTGFRLARTK